VKARFVDLRRTSRNRGALHIMSGAFDQLQSSRGTPGGAPLRILFWGLLATPAVAWCVSIGRSGDPALAEELVHPSGALAAFLLIFTLLATPLRRMAPGLGGPALLMRGRRALGVASFGYAALHTVFYLFASGSAAAVITDLPRFDIWTGWVSLLILVPLALTSTDRAVKALGPRWKPLQRWTYAAAILGLLHVVSLNDWENPWEPLAFAAPLIVLEMWRIVRYLRRRTARMAGT
jgi:sulfoxide reductase heme-binding subunit YedZ